jgi:hypothetical protein
MSELPATQDSGGPPVAFIDLLFILVIVFAAMLTTTSQSAATKETAVGPAVPPGPGVTQAPLRLVVRHDGRLRAAVEGKSRKAEPPEDAWFYPYKTDHDHGNAKATFEEQLGSHSGECPDGACTMLVDVDEHVTAQQLFPVWAAMDSVSQANPRFKIMIRWVWKATANSE